MNPKLSTLAFFIFILILLTLAACGTQPGRNTPTPQTVMLLGTPVLIVDPAIEEAVLTQEMNDADSQAAATANVVRANAQATLNSANATLGAAQTQDQNAADLIAAQVAATAQVIRANAQATLNSASSTQSAALTEDAIHQTQTADLATTSAAAVLDQQNKNELAGSTQTAIANLIATQTQSAAATSQWYADQGRQRGEQMQGPIAFLLVLCLPTFIVLVAGSLLWGYWRWVKVKQGPRILKNPVEKLQTPAVEPTVHPQVYLDSNIVDRRHHLTKPDDQVGRWLDEVKSEILNTDEKDKDESTNN